MNIFFDNWMAIARTLIIGVSTYIGLIVFLRISGKRTLAKMNAFDLVVTVALGSMLATTLLSKDTALMDGLFALGLMITLQYVLASLSVHSSRFCGWVKSEPTLLFFRGEFLDAKLREQRVVRDEVLSAIRARGILDLAAVEAVVLETDGSFSVVQRAAGALGATSLAGVPDASQVETRHGS